MKFLWLKKMQYPAYSLMIKNMPMRGQYYHAFLDFTKKVSANWDTICQRRSICSDHPSGDKGAWHKDICNHNSSPLHILIYIKWRLYQQSFGRTFYPGCSVFQRNSRQKRSLECEEDRQQRPSCKGQISPAEWPPPLSGGEEIWWWDCGLSMV